MAESSKTNKLESSISSPNRKGKTSGLKKVTRFSHSGSVNWEGSGSFSRKSANVELASMRLPLYINADMLGQILVGSRASSRLRSCSASSSMSRSSKSGHEAQHWCVQTGDRQPTVICSRRSSGIHSSILRRHFFVDRSRGRTFQILRRE